VIAVVVPAFNEAAGLRTLLPRVPASLLGLPVRVIVVSDGSTDGTGAVALGHGAVVVHLPVHRGKGAALRAGLAHALELGPSCLVTMDADGQHDPADLERLVRPVLVDGCALAAGSRFLSDPSRGPTPRNRYLVRRATIAVLRATIGRAYTDPFCGYRCFSRQALQAIRLHGDHYQSELEALFEAAIHGLEVVEVPVPREYPAGWSRMGASIGGLLGRMWVIAQYASTIARKTRELRRARATTPPSEVAHCRALAGLRSDEGATATEE
jgi:glycosyltransferase involved in cell wall biosynthesis